MKKYKVLDIEDMSIVDIENKLNELAEIGWRYCDKLKVCYTKYNTDYNGSVVADTYNQKGIILENILWCDSNMV